MTEPARLSDPDPCWADEYAAVRARIADALSNLDPTIEHIGSTAVPIRAKPIIDIQVAVAESDRDGAITALCQLGFVDHGDAGVPGREYLTSRPAVGASVNVHLFAVGNPLLEDNRAIRDYLKAHPDVAKKYVAVKERAIAQGFTDLLSYSHAKGECVGAIREAAYRWRRAG